MKEEWKNQASSLKPRRIIGEVRVKTFISAGGKIYILTVVKICRANAKLYKDKWVREGKGLILDT